MSWFVFGWSQLTCLILALCIRTFWVCVILNTIDMENANWPCLLYINVCQIDVDNVSSRFRLHVKLTMSIDDFCCVWICFKWCVMSKGKHCMVAASTWELQRKGIAPESSELSPSLLWCRLLLSCQLRKQSRESGIPLRLNTSNRHVPCVESSVSEWGLNKVFS